MNTLSLIQRKILLKACFVIMLALTSAFCWTLNATAQTSLPTPPPPPQPTQPPPIPIIYWSKTSGWGDPAPILKHTTVPNTDLPNPIILPTIQWTRSDQFPLFTSVLPEYYLPLEIDQPLNIALPRSLELQIQNINYQNQIRLAQMVYQVHALDTFDPLRFNSMVSQITCAQIAQQTRLAATHRSALFFNDSIGVNLQANILTNQAMAGAYSDYIDEIISRDVTYGARVSLSILTTAISPGLFNYGELATELLSWTGLNRFFTGAAIFEDAVNERWNTTTIDIISALLKETYLRPQPLSGSYSRTINAAFTNLGYQTNITGISTFQPSSFNNPLWTFNSGWSQTTYTNITTAYTPPVYNPTIYYSPTYYSPTYIPPIYIPPIYIPPPLPSFFP